MAEKKLITDADVRRALAEGRRTLELLPDTLITPLARDTARAHGLTFATRLPSPAPTPQPTRATHTVAVGSDHGGFRYKEELKSFIAGLGWRILDVGTNSEASCDYPDFAFAVARAVQDGMADFGVMVDGAGVGSAMVCNKVTGIRAACAYNEFTAWNARAHNDANVLTLGSRTLGIEVCKRIVDTFLNTSFEGGRHARRVEKIGDVERRFLPGQDPEPSCTCDTQDAH